MNYECYELTCYEIIKLWNDNTMQLKEIQLAMKRSVTCIIKFQLNQT